MFEIRLNSSYNDIIPNKYREEGERQQITHFMVIIMCINKK